MVVVGGGAERTEKLLRKSSVIKGEEALNKAKKYPHASGNTVDPTVCVHIYYYCCGRHENTVHGEKNYQFIAGKLTVEKFAKNYASRRSNYWLC